MGQSGDVTTLIAMTMAWVSIHISFTNAVHLSGTGMLSHPNITTPTACLDTTKTLVGLVTCLRPFLRPENSSAKPLLDAGQRDTLHALVLKVLAQPEDCMKGHLHLPPQLSHMVISLFPVNSQAHSCVLIEKTTTEHGWFKKGWGVWALRVHRPSPMVSFSQRRLHLTLHIASPHPVADGPYIDVQAATVFDGSPSALTLLVSGHHRLAASTDSSCEPGHPISDPPYNQHDFITVISQATLTWTLQHGHAITHQPMKSNTHEQHHRLVGAQSAVMGSSGAGASRCRDRTMWLQLHGKADTSCPDSTIFLSAGLSNTTWSDMYHEHSGSPVERLLQALQAAMPSWAVHTPASTQGGSCPLKATTNVFGRYLNGVPLGEYCSRSAGQQDLEQAPCGGAFVHAEQGRDARDPKAWPAWVSAINAACA